MLAIDRRYLGAAALLVFLLGFAGGIKYEKIKEQKQIPAEIISDTLKNESDKPDQEEIIMVYVTGAVHKPGVYRLLSGARVYEAVEMAEALPNANLSSINMAQKIVDEQPIVVPGTGEEVSPPPEISSSSIYGVALQKPGGSGKININSADAQELEKLPGIGLVLAERIIEYRTIHGQFKNPEDINEVSGIGDKKFDEIKDLITVR
ncbi:MAG: ComEA family DNA-binding protein [Syntrophomonas sp.]|nr:ComEA family DNA-binding protein [Syntrophomonas sp.]